MGDSLVLKKQKPEKKLSNNKTVAKKNEQKKTKQCLNNLGKVVIKATMIASKNLQFLFGEI